MPQKRARKTRSIVDAPRSFIRPEFLDAGDRPFEPGLGFWAIHALHWNALLAAIILAIVIGASILNGTPVFAG
ncbi:hypothetical protein KBC59_02090 [Patescibacteria group bacterium]|nr:hypothetical protein [Patescibacteria group bacterium]